MAASTSLEARLRSLLEAVEIVHQHGVGTLQSRVMAACQLLFPETYNGFELWDVQTGAYEGFINAPFDEKTLPQVYERLAEVVPTQNPVFKQIVAGVEDPIRLSDLTTLRELRRTEYFEIAFKALNLKYQMVIPLKNSTHQGGVCFNRGGQKDFTAEDMEIIRILGRHTVIAHEAEKVLTATTTQRTAAAERDYKALRRAGLTRRECEVLAWMEQGKRDREIAIILGISYRTVTNHVHSILRKLQVETRTAAVAAHPHANPAAISDGK